MSMAAAAAPAYTPPAAPDFFIQTPVSLVRCRALTPTQKTTYEVLLSYADADGWTSVGQVRLAVEVGVSERTLRTTLHELQAAGLVEARRRGQGLTTQYRPLRVPLRSPGAPTDRQPLPFQTGKMRRSRPARVAGESDRVEKESEERDHPPPAPARIEDLVSGEGEAQVNTGNEQAEIAADAELIMEATGMDPAAAATVAQEAAAQGKPPGYVAELVDHVITAPGVRNPAGCLRALVQRGEHRRRPSLRPAPGHPPALDPDKYLRGKYAHLFNRPLPASILEREERARGQPLGGPGRPL